MIADDVWAKLLWAGLNITPEDFARPAEPEGAGAYLLSDGNDPRSNVVWLFAVSAAMKSGDCVLGACVGRKATDRRCASWMFPSARRRRPSRSRWTDRRSGHQCLGEGSTRAGKTVRRQNGGDGGLPVPASDEASRGVLSESLPDPQAVSKGRSAAARSARKNYRSSSAVHHRHAAVQRKGADEPLRAARMARAQDARLRPNGTRRSHQRS